MPTSPRATALTVLLEVERGASAAAALDAALAGSELDARDRALVTEFVDGTLRWQGRLDYLLAALLTRPLATLEPPLRLLLRLGAYQLTQMRIPAHAAVHETVALARQHGHEGTATVANAVLRRLAREAEAIPLPDPTQEPVAYLATAHSHPAWLVERWLARWGFAETEALLQANNLPSPQILRVNGRWISREGLQVILAQRGIDTEPTAISPRGLRIRSGGNLRALEEYREGLFSLQGEGSMVMVELLNPAKDRAGWDLAAGVGGKTTYLAEWVDDSGTLLATDTSTGRLAVLTQELARLELQSVTVAAADARTHPVPADSLDYAFLDAPCSGTGALRRQADARWRKAPADLHALPCLQGELLASAARACHAGGLLLYCTCSLEPEENEQVVEAFLATHPDWRLEPAGRKHRTLPAEARDPAGYVRLLPHRDGTDGFFAARLVKCGVPPAESGA
jgi:16S rRNA (cytosine967-C5)-methyltransferase